MRSLRVLAVVFLVCLVAGVVLAQNDEKPPESLAWIYHVTVKSGHEMEFEKGLAAHMNLHKEAGDPWERMVWMAVTGDEVGSYYIRSGNHTWADFDNETEIPGDREHLMEHVMPHAASVSSAISEWARDVTRWPEDYGMPKMIELTVFHLRPGGWRPFYHAVEKIHSMIEEKDLPMNYSFNWTVSGGSDSEMTLAVPHKSWADFKPMEQSFWGAMEEVYGDYESDVLRKMLDKSVASSESFIVVARPDLSVMPEE